MNKTATISLLALSAIIAITAYSFRLTSVEADETQVELENYMKFRFSKRILCRAFAREIVEQRLRSNSPSEVHFKTSMLKAFTGARGVDYCTSRLIAIALNEGSDASECLNNSGVDEFKLKSSCILRIPLQELW